MGENGTHIRVSEDTWKRLNKRKEPGDTFDDVIRRGFGFGGVENAE